MQVVLEILGALTATVTIIDSEYLQLGPLFGRYPWAFLLRLDDIKNDRNSVLICFTYGTHICIRCESFDRTKGLGTDLARLKEGQRALRLVFLQKLRHGGLDAF